MNFESLETFPAAVAAEEVPNEAMLRASVPTLVI